jgi:hypothetical protein
LSSVMVDSPKPWSKTALACSRFAAFGMLLTVVLPAQPDVMGHALTLPGGITSLAEHWARQRT